MTSRLGALALAVLAAVLLAAVPSAGATTLTTGQTCEKADCEDNTRITGEPGERNDLQFAPNESGVRIADAGAELRLVDASGCTAIDAHAAVCPQRFLYVALGDEDDQLHVAAAGDVSSIQANGGPGDDTIDLRAAGQQATGGWADLDGGPGDDVIFGVAGFNSVTLSAGADRIDTGPETGSRRNLLATGPDVLAPVIDLAAGTVTAGGDVTHISEFHFVAASMGTILGTDEADELHVFGGTADGRGGDDRLEGFGTLRGGSGDDSVSVEGPAHVVAGSGDDTIELQRRYAGASVTCGAGHDTVEDRAGLRRPPTLGRSCETLSMYMGPTTAQPAPVVTRHSVLVRLRCARLLRLSCRGRLRATGFTRSVGFSLRSGASRTVRLPRLPGVSLRRVLDDGTLRLMLTTLRAAPHDATSWRARPHR